MKQKDKQQLHAKTAAELATLLSESRGKISSLRLESYQDKGKNSRSVYLERKQIARIATILKEKETGEK